MNGVKINILWGSNEKNIKKRECKRIVTEIGGRCHRHPAAGSSFNLHKA